MLTVWFLESIVLGAASWNLSQEVEGLHQMSW